jgi:hypothetical protein
MRNRLKQGNCDEKQLLMQQDDEWFTSYQGAVLLMDEMQIKIAY